MVCREVIIGDFKRLGKRSADNSESRKPKSHPYMMERVEPYAVYRLAGEICEDYQQQTTGCD